MAIWFCVDHHSQFEAEMKKYIVPNMTPAHSQSVIRHLVSANVLLKNQLDKESEEKKVTRKKALQMEHESMERERIITASKKECAELRERLRIAEENIENRSHSHESKTLSNSRVDSPSKPLTSTPESILFLAGPNSTIN